MLHPDGSTAAVGVNDGSLWLLSTAAKNSETWFRPVMLRTADRFIEDQTSDYDKCDSIRGLAVSADGLICAGGKSSGSFSLYSATSGACVRTITIKGSKGMAACFSSRGDFVAVGGSSSGRLKVIPLRPAAAQGGQTQPADSKMTVISAVSAKWVATLKVEAGEILLLPRTSERGQDELISKFPFEVYGAGEKLWRVTFDPRNGNRLLLKKNEDAVSCCEIRPESKDEPLVELFQLSFEEELCCAAWSPSGDMDRRCAGRSSSSVRRFNGQGDCRCHPGSRPPSQLCY